jgi:chorismate mutase
MEENDATKGLESLRDELRKNDDQIMGLVIRRSEIAREIGALKKKHGIPILDVQREAFNIQRNRDIARDKIPEAMVDELTDLLANWARELQKMAR